MTGVIIPSEKSSAVPNRARRDTSTTVRRPISARPLGRISASSAMMPPSPWLSARITNTMYLTTTAMISDQKISDRTPRTFSNAGRHAVAG